MLLAFSGPSHQCMVRNVRSAIFFIPVVIRMLAIPDGEQGCTSRNLRTQFIVYRMARQGSTVQARLCLLHPCAHVCKTLHANMSKLHKKYIN
jgi:hypothetical protein